MIFLKALAVLGLAVYLVLAAFLYSQQSKIYFPAPKTHAHATPADIGLTFEDLRIPVETGGYLHAWWIPVRDSASAAIVFHGNAGVIDDMVKGQLQPLANLNLNLLLIDYRGYGASSALEPSERTVSEDADAALLYLRHSRLLSPRQTFVIGGSLGTGPAVYLASKHPGLAGAILESPISSVDEIARRSPYLRILPLGVILRTHFDNYERIAAIHCPILIAVGEQDTTTPPEMARALFDRAHEPKQLTIVPGAGHFNLVPAGGAPLQRALTEFVSTYRAK
jgi:fermentation-respiration switch protein FrsA (DUF1100 family)